jgi:NADH-quinone oxidoreductase subunit K
MEIIYFNYINYIPIKESFYFSFSLFFIGFIGILLNKQNLLILIMSAEVMLLGISLNFIFFSIYSADPKGQVFALFLISIAAAETAIGLGILIAKYRVSGAINFSLFKNLKY